MRLYAISGSLRRVSTNTALLRTMAGNAPAGVAIDLFDGLGNLPIFNPDCEGENTPASVTAFAAQIAAADGLIISCPEYAHGIPGGLKNALDWLVSRDEIPFKPVMLLSASYRNAISHAALQEVLRTMSVRLMPEVALRVPLLGSTPEEIASILQDAALATEMAQVLRHFESWINAAERAV